MYILGLGNIEDVHIPMCYTLSTILYKSFYLSLDISTQIQHTPGFLKKKEHYLYPANNILNIFWIFILIAPIAIAVHDT